ncbi:MAG: class I SAM-dependent methyltransferase [Candidatus Aegiribacteria sp.]|nr:class I SAM-dependent methyltransferase [Candidatus Aegiribacteria sp.]
MKYEDGKVYDQQTNGPYYQLWFEMIQHYLDIYLPNSGKVLDAGGGTGEFSIRAANLRSDISVVNYDLSQSMLDSAKEKYSSLGLDSRIDNEQGDIMAMPFENYSFEYVMCFGDALSFCTDLSLAFSELARVTGKDRYLHLSVNSFWGNFHALLGKGSDLGYSFSDIMDYYRSRILHKDGKSTDCRSFTMNELTEFGILHNLKIVRCFAAPVFPAHKDWLEDSDTAKKLRDFQFQHCEDKNLLEFGNHLNVIYKKQ